EGYVAEMLIPWAAFETKKAPSVGDTYRGNFFVFDDPLRKDAVMWSPRLNESAHRVSRFGRLTFVDKAALTKVAADPKSRRITPGAVETLQVGAAPKAAKTPAVAAPATKPAGAAPAANAPATPPAPAGSN